MCRVTLVSTVAARLMLSFDTAESAYKSCLTNATALLGWKTNGRLLFFSNAAESAHKSFQPMQHLFSNKHARYILFHPGYFWET